MTDVWWEIHLLRERIEKLEEKVENIEWVKKEEEK